MSSKRPRSADEESEEKGDALEQPPARRPREQGESAEVASPAVDLSLLPFELVMETLSRLDVVRAGQLLRTLPRQQAARFRNTIYHNLALRDFRSPLTGRVYSVVRVWEYMARRGLYDMERIEMRSLVARDVVAVDEHRRCYYPGAGAPPLMPADFWMRAYAQCSAGLAASRQLPWRPLKDCFTVADNLSPLLATPVTQDLLLTRVIRLNERLPGQHYAQPASTPRSAMRDLGLQRLVPFDLLHFTGPLTRDFERPFAMMNPAILTHHATLVSLPRRLKLEGDVFLLNAIDMTPTPLFAVRQRSAGDEEEVVPLVATPLFTVAQVREAMAWLADLLTSPAPDDPAHASRAAFYRGRASFVHMLHLLDTRYGSYLVQHFDPDRAPHSSDPLGFVNSLDPLSRAVDEGGNPHWWEGFVAAAVHRFGWAHLDLFAAILPLSHRYGARCSVPATYSLPAGPGQPAVPLIEAFGAHTLERGDIQSKRLKYSLRICMLRYDMETVNQHLVHPASSKDPLRAWLQSQESDDFPDGYRVPVPGTAFPDAALDASLSLGATDFLADTNENARRAYDRLALWATTLRASHRDGRPRVFRAQLSQPAV